MDDERPKVVEAVHWAAKNGDRSENGDYLYGKKRLREIDRRIRFLTKRLEVAEVTDPSVHHGSDQVFFGATVRYADETGEERTVTILGIDEADSAQSQVSWISPIARALLKAREGDVVKLATPGGVHEIEVLAVRYPPPSPTGEASGQGAERSGPPPAPKACAAPRAARHRDACGRAPRSRSAGRSSPAAFRRPSRRG